MDIKTRMYIVGTTRERVEEDSLDFEAQDELACHLLSLSAALIEAGESAEALEALKEAERHLVLIPQNPFFRNRPEPKVPRVLVLLAAVYYNISVLFFESGDNKTGKQLLQTARDSLNSLPEEKRSGELYDMCELALSNLGQVVRA